MHELHDLIGEMAVMTVAGTQAQGGFLVYIMENFQIEDWHFSALARVEASLAQLAGRA